MAEELTSTKEKILMDTNQLVISLNTQVAVLTNSNNALKDVIEGYMGRMDRQLEKMDERDATLDQRATILRNDLTKVEGKIDRAQDDIRELRGKSNLLDFMNLVVTAVVAALAYFWGR
jgi:predicted RNase H-like nuclease (RuvC/YqgF family)